MVMKPWSESYLVDHVTAPYFCRSKFTQETLSNTKVFADAISSVLLFCHSFSLYHVSLSKISICLPSLCCLCSFLRSPGYSCTCRVLYDVRHQEKVEGTLELGYWGFNEDAIYKDVLKLKRHWQGLLKPVWRSSIEGSPCVPQVLRSKRREGSLQDWEPE